MVTYYEGLWALNATFAENSFDVRLNPKTNGFVACLRKVSWVIWCKMHFESFPLDEQVNCQFKANFSIFEYMISFGNTG